MSVAARPELAIVGAGPVGLYAAHYAGFRGLETVLIEALPEVGGQVSAFYPEDVIYDVPALPAVTGRELVERLYEQARRFPLELRLGEEVVALERENDRLVLVTESRDSGGGPAERRSYEARAVLLAVGIGRFAPQRIREPAIARFEGRGLTYHVADPRALEGRRVVVIGATQRAVDLSLALARAGADTTLVHRRDRLQAGADALANLHASGVRFLPFRELVALHGGDRVEQVELVGRLSGARETLETDVIVPCHGFAASAAATRRFGVALEGDAVLVDSRMATSARGIYAAGDGAAYPGKVRVLAADFGEACTAINNIASAVIPGARLFPGYSSHGHGAARRPGPRKR